MHLKALENQEERTPTKTRWEEMKGIKAEISKIETRNDANNTKNQ